MKNLKKICSFFPLFFFIYIFFSFFFNLEYQKLIGYSLTPGGKCNHVINFKNKSLNSKFETDFAIFGGSSLMVRFAHDEYKTQKHFNQVFQKNINFINNGHSHYSIEKEYVLLKDFYKNHKSKYIIMMFKPDEKIKLHQDFKKIADVEDIIDIVNHDLVLFIITLKDFVTFRTKNLFKKVYIDENYIKKIQKTKNCYDGAYDKNKKNNKFLTKKTGIYKKYHDTFFNKNLDVKNLQEDQTIFQLSKKEKYYLKKIISLAKENDSEIIFIYTSEVNKKKIKKNFVKNFNEYTNKKLLVENKEMKKKFNENYVNFFRDFRHLNNEGRAYYLPKILNRIKHEY